MKESPSKLDSINNLAGQAIFAVSQISAAKKQRVSDYDERIRLLRDLISSLLTKRTNSQQLEMFDIEAALTPALSRFINNPTAGLD